MQCIKVYWGKLHQIGFVYSIGIYDESLKENSDVT